MAINKVVFGNDTLIDITDTTATASDVTHGKYFYDASGVKIEGTAVGGGMIVVETEDEYGGTIVDISGEPVTLQTKSVTPAAASQIILPDEGYTGLSKVNLAAVPTEEKTAITNGDVLPTTGKFLSKVTVNVSSTINNQNKSVEPSESQQSVTADSGYTGLGTVTVGAISSNYVGSNIPVNPTVSVSGKTVSVPSGYYNAAVSTDVATAAQAVPSISVSNAGVITATATQAAGYVAAGTTSKTYNLTTQAAATITPTESSQTAVSAGKYTTGAVTVAAISSDYVGSNIPVNPTPTASGKTVTIPVGYYDTQTTKDVTTTTIAQPTISVSASGLIIASIVQTAGYVSAGNSSNTLQLTTQAAKTVSPTESEQTAVASDVYMTGVIKVGAISSNYVGSNIPTRSSSDLTTSGSAVTVPSGYYAATATKNISAGSATTPATTISITPGVSLNSSTGVVTATASGSQYVTPTVSAGYVSAGTSGRVTVSGSNTLSLTTQAAATITPSTSAQTAVASHRYTTGTVTVAAIPSQYKDITGVTATASDVVSGKTFVNSSGSSTTGSLVIQHYYTGSGAPAAATGSNGDIYLRTS